MINNSSHNRTLVFSNDSTKFASAGGVVARREYQSDDFYTEVNKYYSNCVSRLSGTDSQTSSSNYLEDFLKDLSNIPTPTSRFLLGGGGNSDPQDLDYHIELELWALLANLYKRSYIAKGASVEIDPDTGDFSPNFPPPWPNHKNFFAKKNDQMDNDYVKKLLREHSIKEGGGQGAITFHQFEKKILMTTDGDGGGDVRLIRATHYLDWLQRVYKRSAPKGLIHFHGLPDEPPHNIAWYHIRCGNIEAAVKELSDKGSYLLPHFMLDSRSSEEDDNINIGAYMLRCWNFCEKLSKDSKSKDEARTMASVCGHLEVLLKCKDETPPLKCSIDYDSFTYRLWCRLKCDYIMTLYSIYLKYLKECHNRFGSNFPNCDKGDMEKLEKWIGLMKKQKDLHDAEFLKHHVDFNSVEDSDRSGGFLNMDYYFNCENNHDPQVKDSNRFISEICQRACNLSSGDEIFKDRATDFVTETDYDSFYNSDASKDKFKIGEKRSRVWAHLLIWLSSLADKEGDTFDNVTDRFFFKKIGKSFGVRKDSLENAVALYIVFLCKARQWSCTIPYFKYISKGRKVKFLTKILSELALFRASSAKLKSQQEQEINLTLINIREHMEPECDDIFRSFVDTVFFNRVVNNPMLMQMNVTSCYLSDYRVYSDPTDVGSHDKDLLPAFGENSEAEIEAVFILIGSKSKSKDGFDSEVQFRCCRLIQCWLNRPSPVFSTICKNIETLKKKCDDKGVNYGDNRNAISKLFTYWADFANLVSNISTTHHDSIKSFLGRSREAKDRYLKNCVDQRLDGVHEIGLELKSSLQGVQVRNQVSELFVQYLRVLDGYVKSPSCSRIDKKDSYYRLCFEVAEYFNIHQDRDEPDHYASDRDTLVDCFLVISEFISLLDVFNTFDRVLEKVVPLVLKKYTEVQYQRGKFENITDLAGDVASGLHIYCDRSQKRELLNSFSIALQKQNLNFI